MLLASWVWLLVALVPLIFLERWIHRHLQGLWLLIFRDPNIALVMYSITMLPGVLLHEAATGSRPRCSACAPGAFR